MFINLCVVHFYFEILTRFGAGSHQRSLDAAMAASADVHVRICEQEIIKYDLEIKALIQVLI